MSRFGLFIIKFTLFCFLLHLFYLALLCNAFFWMLADQLILVTSCIAHMEAPPYMPLDDIPLYDKYKN